MVNFLTVKISDDCEHCLTCVSECPTGALTYYKAGFMHNAYECSYCESCMMVCPKGAIIILHMED